MTTDQTTETKTATQTRREYMRAYMRKYNESRKKPRQLLTDKQKTENSRFSRKKYYDLNKTTINTKKRKARQSKRIVRLKAELINLEQQNKIKTD